MFLSRAFLPLLTITITVAVPPSPSSQSETTSQPTTIRSRSVSDWLVPIVGTHKVKVWQVQWPARYTELAERMTTAVSKNQEWWLEHVKKAETEKPLPWHENLGLSEDEYYEMLRLANKSEFKAVATRVLNIRRKDDGLIGFDASDEIEDLTDLSIDLKTESVITPIGRLITPKATKGDRIAHFGAWEGLEWKLSNVAPEQFEGEIATLSVGRLVRNNEPFIYYKAKKAIDERATYQSRVLVTFPKK